MGSPVPLAHESDPGIGRSCHRAPPGVEAGRRSGGRVGEPELSPPLCMLATGTEVAGYPQGSVTLPWKLRTSEVSVVGGLPVDRPPEP